MDREACHAGSQRVGHAERLNSISGSDSTGTSEALVGISLAVCGFPRDAAVKNPSAHAGDTGDRVRFLGGEDPLEKEMKSHPSILA